MIDCLFSLTEVNQYATYLLNTHLEQASVTYLQLARQQQLPLLSYYNHLPDDQLLAIARQKVGEFLQQVIQNQLLQGVQELMNRWEQNELNGMGATDIREADVLLYFGLQKGVMTHFLPHYTQDVSLAVRIVTWIEDFCKRAEKHALATYLKIQQQASRQSQAQLAEVQATAHLGSWEWNLPTDQITWSEEMYRIAGFAPGEIPITPQTYLQLLHIEDRNPAVIAIRRCISDLEPYTLEHRIISKDGTVRWMLCKGKPVFSAAGAVDGVLGVAIDITEQKKAERQLRELNEQLEQRVVERTEELLAANDQIQELLERERAARLEAENQRKQVEALFTQAPVALGIFRGSDFTITLANSALCAIWGKAQEEVLGKPLFEALPELKGQVFEELLKDVLTTGAPFTGHEVPGRITRNGRREEGYLNLVYQPVKDGTGTITGIFAVANEVTEQVLARKKVEESERRVWHILETMPQIAWTTNTEGQNRYLNLKWYEYTGSTASDNFEEVWPLYIHLDDISHLQEQNYKSLILGEPFQMEYRIRNTAGEYRWHLGRMLPLLDEEGHITEWVGTATDIHEQKSKITYLYEVLESIPHLAWTSLPGRSSVNFFNKGWYDFTGLTEEQSMDQGWQIVLHPDDWQRTKEQVAQGRLKKEPWMTENRYRRASDGSYRWHVSRGVPIFNESGDITLWVGTATDIHDQKTALEDLQKTLVDLWDAQHTLEQTLHELHEKNFELDQFVYKTSHDLRSPLSTILGLVSILKQETDEQNKGQYVDLIENRVHKLDRFIHSMLDYSRNTRTVTRREKINLHNLVGECLEALEYMKHFSRLQVNLELGEGVLYSDEFRLRIIFSNLISNAIKYQDFNKEISVLTIQVHFTQDRVQIRFADNGVGIDQQYQDRIFEMFFRATEQSDGSGLGLYIVRQAVVVLGGRLDMESQAGKGTTFTVILPKISGE